MGRPNTELRVRLETPRLYSLNATHSPLVTITSGVGFWNDPLGSLQMAVCHGNVHCRDSESAQTGIGSGSAGTVQASLPSLCGSRLLRPRVGVGQGESQRSPISLLSGSSHLRFLSPRSSDQGPVDVKRKHSRAFLRIRLPQRVFLHPAPTSGYYKDKNRHSPAPQSPGETRL